MSSDPITALLDVGIMAISRIWPDPIQQAQEVRKLQELAQKGDLALMKSEVSLLLGQIEINKIEAKSNSIFVAGWRPFVGWVGGLSFAYASILEPLMRFIANMRGYTGDFPEINTNLTIQVLLGMLGLGVMRSFDKKNGSETNKIQK